MENEKIVLEKFTGLINKAAAQMTELAETVTEMNRARVALEKFFEEIKPYTLPESREKELNEIDKLLSPGLSFKKTVTIAEYLQRKDEEFKPLNTMQIGRLVAKCGFRPGFKDKKRGFYVTFKEL